MLRKRIITVLTFNDGVLFRTKLFRPDYRYTLNFVDAWSVDEIVVLDVTRPGTGDKKNFYQTGCWASARGIGAWAREGQDRGAGEILITAIEKDGWLQGYDLELCRRVVDAVSVPVLVLGGAGNWKHFLDGFNDGGASAVCTQNIYHFTESSVKNAKAYLHKAGANVRI